MYSYAQFDLQRLCYIASFIPMEWVGISLNGCGFEGCRNSEEIVSGSNRSICPDDPKTPKGQINKKPFHKAVNVRIFAVGGRSSPPTK